VRLGFFYSQNLKTPARKPNKPSASSRTISKTKEDMTKNAEMEVRKWMVAKI